MNDTPTDVLVDSRAGATLLGGGDVRTTDLEEALSLAPDLIAADGGAQAALSAGRMPLKVIGDMDSLPPDAGARLDAGVAHRVAEQDTTDFDKVMARVRAPFALAVGFLGGRIDHELANLNTLVRNAGMPCLMLGVRDVVLAAPPRIDIALAPGTRVSLFPLAPVSGRSRGLHWPIDGLTLTPGGVHGTSNRVADDARSVRLSLDAPGVLVILPREALAAALAGLRAAPRWHDAAR